MLSIATVSGDELRATGTLRDEIRELVAPSYLDPTSILGREFAECSRAYLAREPNGRLVCFYLTNWHTIHVAHKDRPAVHLGLSATRHDTKGRGNVAVLYVQCVREARAWEQANGQQLVLWSTTASPTVYLAVANYLADPQPKPDGSYTPQGAMLANALRRQLGVSPAGAGEHPFVLHGIATGTRYSTAESRRIERICHLKRFTLFEQLAVDESKHDRLLFAAYPPDDFRARS